MIQRFFTSIRRLSTLFHWPFLWLHHLLLKFPAYLDLNDQNFRRRRRCKSTSEVNERISPIVSVHRRVVHKPAAVVRRCLEGGVAGKGSKFWR
ncbi:hypothetical protein MtrunA17_Chr7g0258141 [Medicago truncatula]|uniref:Transmembrane protein n=1 Tax=Medicago truncatula TaxID=3880 RepID=A2Q3E7_MEDTR|nr:hypothetical protein MtrDRAFT_AC155881g3v1 [Medicago truncatula]RHN47915.1 hypothetical protein MtrunA17_Chr7g0258141 [Medicago truncatula]